MNPHIPFAVATRRKARAAVTAAVLASTALTAPSLAVAAEQTRIQLAQAVLSFDIPAQPLESALEAFANRTGWQVGIPGTLVRGVQSVGVTGEYAPEEALRRLLAGSGLNYRMPAAGTVTLTQGGGPEGGAVELAPISVEGWRPTETVGYRPGVISSATKTPTLIENVPNSVSVVTEEVIEDQNATSVREALRNVPGVLPGDHASNVAVQEEVTIRGFEAQLINVNGVERRSTGQLSTANIESVEVLKGPFSVIYGELSPGGMVNIQTKRPQAEAAFMVEGGLSQATGGRGTQGRGVIDATGSLNENDSLLYRFIASAEGGSSFIEEVDEEKYLINPMVSFLGFDHRLRVDADFSYLRNDGTFKFGIPSRDGKPDTRIAYDAFLGAGDSYKLTEDYTAELRASYDVTSATTIDGALTYHHNRVDFRALRPWGASGTQVAANDTVVRHFDDRVIGTTDVEAEVNGTHNFTAGATEWRLTGGADIRQTAQETEDWRRITNFDTVNVLNPNNVGVLPSADDPRIVVRDNPSSTVDSYGLYGQAEVWIHDRVKLLAGGRYDNVTNTNEVSGDSREDSNFSPSGAVLFKATPETSLYVSYTSSFEEQGWATDASGNPLDPMEGRQWEAGVKQNFFDGNLLATVSVFTLKQINEAQWIAPNTYVPVGEIETNGVELELQGQIADDWRVTAGYTYLDNEITNSEYGWEGNHNPNTPEHAASVFLMHDIYETSTERLSVGGGAFYVSEVYTDSSNAVELPEHVTVDLTGQYAFEAGGRDIAQRQPGWPLCRQLRWPQGVTVGRA
ncbi:TonB-dependent siderophore receptor [Caenispirillum salinarum]|uniref:TonB-dependent siderophore receptor n=1 Tax=Caenispirillum salinarum TaxID=859058 RepID=UPI00384AFF5E